MKYIYFIFLILLFFKSYFYADYVQKEKKNKYSGIALKILSSIILILSLYILFKFY